MKTKRAVILFLIIASHLQAEQKNFDIQSNGVGVISELLCASGIEAGRFTVERKELYNRIVFQDNDTSIIVLSFPKERKELYYLDTKSPHFFVFGVYVGMNEAILKEKLGDPVRYKKSGNSAVLYYSGRQYMLSIEIANNEVVRIYLNPFE